MPEMTCPVCKVDASYGNRAWAGWQLAKCQCGWKRPTPDIATGLTGGKP